MTAMLLALLLLLLAQTRVKGQPTSCTVLIETPSAFRALPSSGPRYVSSVQCQGTSEPIIVAQMADSIQHQFTYSWNGG